VIVNFIRLPRNSVYSQPYSQLSYKTARRQGEDLAAEKLQKQTEIECTIAISKRARQQFPRSRRSRRRSRPLRRRGCSPTERAGLKEIVDEALLRHYAQWDKKDQSLQPVPLTSDRSTV
jgi:hypothetical protein